MYLVTLTIVYCLTLNSYSCKTLEMIPIGRAITSLTDCIQGGAIGSTTFIMDHAEYTVKGYRCEESFSEDAENFSNVLKEHVK